MNNLFILHAIKMRRKFLIKIGLPSSNIVQLCPFRSKWTTSYTCSPVVL